MFKKLIVLAIFLTIVGVAKNLPAADFGIDAVSCRDVVSGDPVQVTDKFPKDSPVVWIY